MTDAYYAEKTPHSTGLDSGIFFDLENAHEWLQDAIADEPEVERWEVQENDITAPAYTYRVVEGVGEVAGTIYKAPIRGDMSNTTPTDRLDAEHHNAPKDGNDDPVFTEGEQDE